MTKPRNLGRSLGKASAPSDNHPPANARLAAQQQPRHSSRGPTSLYRLPPWATAIRSLGWPASSSARPPGCIPQNATAAGAVDIGTSDLGNNFFSSASHSRRLLWLRRLPFPPPTTRPSLAIVASSPPVPHARAQTTDIMTGDIRARALNKIASLAASSTDTSFDKSDLDRLCRACNANGRGREYNHGAYNSKQASSLARIPMVGDAPRLHTPQWLTKTVNSRVRSPPSPLQDRPQHPLCPERPEAVLPTDPLHPGGALPDLCPLALFPKDQPVPDRIARLSRHRRSALARHQLHRAQGDCYRRHLGLYQCLQPNY